MNGFRRNVWISIVLGILSLCALVLSALALADIAHGESDLTNEWMVVRLAFAVIFIFTVFSVITLARLLRGRRD